MHVAVITGGMSLEREIALGAGRACETALLELGHQVSVIDAGRDLGAELLRIAPDVAFIALHGRWGEDGCVQGLLEWMRIPYTHSGVMASALAMDKDRSKAVFRAAGVPVAASVMAHRDAIAKGHVMTPPYIVKPHNEGSSLGGFALVEPGDAPPVMPSNEREMFMVEDYVPGRELTVGVMGDKALTVSEIACGKWYDYEKKYALLDVNRRHPADLPDDIFERCLRLSERAHLALGCRGISRTDFRWDPEKGLDGIIALETNTQPGLRPDANIAQQAALQGIDFAALCAFLLEDAGLDRDRVAA